MLISSYKAQRWPSTSLPECAENEKLMMDYDIFCCNMETDNNTYKVGFPGTMDRRFQKYVAPNVCNYVPRKGFVSYNCVCNEGLDFKLKTFSTQSTGDS